MLDNFYILMEKSISCAGKSVDWFLKSYKYKRDSYDFKVCRLLSIKFKKKWLYYLYKANKNLENVVNNWEPYHKKANELDNIKIQIV
jgi:hypothetical protein